MLKERYEAAELELIKFLNEDIITGSPEGEPEVPTDPDELPPIEF